MKKRTTKSLSSADRYLFNIQIEAVEYDEKNTTVRRIRDIYGDVSKDRYTIEDIQRIANQELNIAAINCNATVFVTRLIIGDETWVRASMRKSL